MASIATSHPEKRARAAAKAPVSAHPAFPAIVALWFAALLGLGSLVLPGVLLDKLITVSRIASLVPSAAPPLGFTAHAAIALAGSFVGAVAGLLVARQVAKAAVPQPKRGFALESARACRPISAPDELGDERLDSPTVTFAPPMQKRRALAMAEDNRRSDYLPTVPLPGHSSEDPAWAEPPLPAVDEAPEPLELAAFAEPEPDNHALETKAADGPQRRRNPPPPATTQQDVPMSDRRILEPAFDEDEQEQQEIGAPAPVPQPFVPAADQPDPLPFAAPSLRRAAPPWFEEDEDEEETELAAAAPDGTELEREIPAEPGAWLSVVEAAGEPITDDRPLEDLGLVQLAARLGTSIARRRARLADRQGARPAPLPLAPLAGAEEFEAAAPEDAARAIADFFGPGGTAAEPAPAAPNSEVAAPHPASVPSSLRDFSLEADDEDDEDALAASLSLPLADSSAAMPASTDEDETEQDDDDGEYSSLLAMKNPFARQQQFVRVDEPEPPSDIAEPAVVFPSPAPAIAAPAVQQPGEGHERLFDPPQKSPESAPRPISSTAPRDPDEAERSLRDALATLQRMSGAA